MSKVIFRHGVMGAAKSMFLMATVTNFRERGFRVLVLKPSTDTRSPKVSSRCGLEMDCVNVRPEDSIYCYIDGSKVPNWIVCDESQFFTKEQIDELVEICDDLGANVICYGLRTDFRGELFEGSKRLFEVADTIEEMKSACECGRKAIINARLVDGKIVTEGNQVQIGGNESYVPMCRRCWHSRMKCQCDDCCETEKKPSA